MYRNSLNWLVFTSVFGSVCFMFPLRVTSGYPERVLRSPPEPGGRRPVYVGMEPTGTAP
jgi:hypothetical protein